MVNFAYLLAMTCVQTVSFLTYLLRSFADCIRPHEESISKSIVSLLVSCPDSVSIRKVWHGQYEILLMKLCLDVLGLNHGMSRKNKRTICSNYLGRLKSRLVLRMLILAQSSPLHCNACHSGCRKCRSVFFI